MSLQVGWATGRPVIDVAVGGVAVTPVLGHATLVIACAEGGPVQQIGVEGAGEAFDAGVLVGLPGWMWSRATPRCWAPCFSAVLMNSGP